LQDSLSPTGDAGSGKKTRPLRVWLYANDHIIEGTVYCFPNQRFIDYLNSVYVFKTRAADKFIPVNDANITLPDGTNRTMKSICLNRDSILFAGAISSAVTEERNINGQRAYPIVHKITVPANLYVATKLYTHAYLISGKMHLAKSKTVIDVLNSDQKFLPLTGVEITPPLFADQIPDTPDFVAVNKDIIIYIE
jgi:hypothetical protein